MDDEYLAAKLGDALEHTSIWADLASGLVKGAIYAAIGIGAVALVGATGGAALALGAAVGLASGFVMGEAIDAVADSAGEVVDDVLGFFGYSPAEARITTGSDNVFIKSKPAARAAGKIPDVVLQAELTAEAEEETPEQSKAAGIAERALQRAWMLTPMGMAQTAGSVINNLTHSSEATEAKPEGWPDEIPSPKQGFFEGMLSPVVTSKHPYASPADYDKVECDKWHLFTDEGLYLAQGSKSVRINSQPASRNGDQSSCEATIKQSQEGRIVRIGGPTVTVRDIKSGKNPWMSLAGEILGSVGVGLLAGGLRCTARTAACMLLAETVGTAVSSVVGAAVGEAIARATSSRHPVHLATGAKLLYGETELDFILPGRIPINWQRLYHSRNQRIGALGQGWTLPFEISLHLAPAENGDGEQIIYTDLSGRELGLGWLPLGGNVYYYDEGFRLWRSQQNIFMLEEDNGNYYLFEANPKKPGYFRLSYQTDRHQNELHYRYDEFGQVTHIYDEAHQQVVALNYCQLAPGISRLQSVWQCRQTQRRQRVSYQYNERGELIAVIDADNRTTRQFAWDSQHHLMVMHQYASGAQSHYRWQLLVEPEREEANDADNGNNKDNNKDKDKDNKATENQPQQETTQHSDANDALKINQKKINQKSQKIKGQTRQWYVVESWLEVDGECQEHLRFDYDLVKRQLSLHQQHLGTSVHQWDKLGQMCHYLDVGGRHWQFNWNDASQLLSAIDPMGGEYQFSYDERGNITRCIDPEGQETRQDWDNDFALIKSKQQPNGAIWHWHYNKLGDLLRLTDPLQQETHYRYDEDGNQIELIDAKGNHYHAKYNDAGQLTEQIDCSGQQTRYFYDDWGTLSSRTDALSHTERYEFNQSDQLIRRQLADNRQEFYRYNERGLLVEHQEFGGNSTRWQHNPRGQVSQRIDAEGKIVQLSYDYFGRLQGLINEKGEYYQFAYDQHHRLIKEYDFSGQEKRYEYNDRDEEIKQQHIPNRSAADSLLPIISEIGRDRIGRPISRWNHDDYIEYHYLKDAIEIKRTSQKERQQAEQEQRPAKFDSLRFEQNLLGQLTAEHNHGGSYQYEYDEIGSLIKTTFPEGETLHHHYYGGGHLLASYLEVNGHRHTLAEYQRDRLHREINRSQGTLSQQLRYDVSGRITHKQSGWQGSRYGVTSLISKVWQYDQQDQIIQLTRHYRAGSVSFQRNMPKDEYYHYDLLGHITQHHRQGESSQQHQYNATGNWLPDGNNPESHNRLTQYQGWSCRYDGFGRLWRRKHDKSKVEQHFTYDSHHRLIKVEFFGESNYEKVEYRYDALGRRIKKTLHPLHYGKPIEDITFHWQGFRLTGEENDLKRQRKVIYVYNQDSYDPLARVDINLNPPKNEQDHQVLVYYYHTQLNGLPEELTNREGAIVWQGSYHLWGKLKAETDMDSRFIGKEQNLRFAGQYYDRETGLHYNTFRYYDPECGHFIQSDPIGLAGGLNTYQYAPNPLTWIDPLGLTTCSITSRVKDNPALLKEAQKLSPAESRGINSLLEQISQGNMSPGIGTKVFDGITEFRHRSGGRIYAIVTGSKVDIVGYSGKGNQPKVISLIKDLFKGEL